MTGPLYLDPRKHIRQVPNQDNDDIGRILSNQHEAEKRDQMVDRMFADFSAYADKDNYISEQEFKRFVPLFSNELKEKVINRTASRDEIDLITTLSEEFYRNYNIQKPTHVVDRYGNDVMPPIPPIQRRLTTMSGNLIEIINEFHTAHAQDDGNAGGLIDLKKKKSIVQLFQGLKMSQFLFDETKDAIDYKRQADALSKYIHKDELDKIAEEQLRVESKPMAPEPTTVNEYEMEYGPVDE